MSDEHLLIEQLAEIESRIYMYQGLLDSETSHDYRTTSAIEDAIDSMREHRKRLEQALEDHHY